jgi:hypothetical protein
MQTADTHRREVPRLVLSGLKNSIEYGAAGGVRFRRISTRASLALGCNPLFKASVAECMTRFALRLIAALALAVLPLGWGTTQTMAAELPPLGLSLAPWTGPDIPGSVASTIKYRLVVTGAAGAAVVLAESGLPAHWIGSFCSDRVCAPFRTELVLPPEGVKVVEFQVVPTSAYRGPIRFRIEGRSGAHRVTTGATIAHV